MVDCLTHGQRNTKVKGSTSCASNCSLGKRVVEILRVFADTIRFTPFRYFHPAAPTFPHTLRPQLELLVSFVYLQFRSNLFPPSSGFCDILAHIVANCPTLRHTLSHLRLFSH